MAFDEFQAFDAEGFLSRANLTRDDIYAPLYDGAPSGVYKPAAYSAIFREVIVKAREEGDFDFENVSITNQLMFMTLNSPIFWYAPRTGETKADIEELAKLVVTCAWRGLGGKEKRGGKEERKDA